MPFVEQRLKSVLEGKGNETELSLPSVLAAQPGPIQSLDTVR